MLYKIEKITNKTRKLVNQFFIDNWFSTDMSIRGEIIDGTKLDGFLIVENQEIIGLATYMHFGNVCEIVSLDSKKENIGIGTDLLKEVERVALENNCKKIRLITTNDNMRALQFYQKRGYYLTKLYPNAMDEVRKAKPDVPIIGENGIPLNDEIELEKSFENKSNAITGKIIAICGKICSGKTHYANKIKQKENAIILSTDEVTYDLINNEQGEFYNQFCSKVNKYLMKKSVELANIGCNVILDWGFWTNQVRKEITEFYKSKDINIEWHYIDVDDKTWEKSIEKRNKRIEEGNGGSDFYLTEGLKRKILDKWERPSKEEIDVWYKRS